jgi:hypothetical protein
MPGTKPFDFSAGVVLGARRCIIPTSATVFTGLIAADMPQPNYCFANTIYVSK